MDDEFTKLDDEFLQNPKVLNKKDSLNINSKESNEINYIEGDFMEHDNLKSAYERLMNMVGYIVYNKYLK